MSLSLDTLAIFIICVVIGLWIWGAVDLLKRELSQRTFTKWLTIIIVMSYRWLLHLSLAGQAEAPSLVKIERFFAMI